MSEKQYLTAPDPKQAKFPKGIPFIIGNEAAERFSFYGMRTILVVFMTKFLVDASHNDATFSDEKAKSIFHLFIAVAYFTPMIGALISDIFWGKYKTILVISLMYCLGHGCLAFMDLGPITGKWDMQPFLFTGIFLIALGAGGIKPCVSAHVGDQFGAGNKHLMTQVFNWFYFSINVGAAISTVLTPWLLNEFGPWLAFGLPGVLMGIATFVFWLGRHSFVHVPPAGFKKWKEETFSADGIRALFNLTPLFVIFVPMFWAIFDQTGSAWVIQADQMNREFGFTWDPSQIQFVNPVMILCGIPIFTYIVYPFFGKFIKVTPLRKIGVGLFLTAASFAISGVIETKIIERSPQIATTIYNDLKSDLASTTPVIPDSFDRENAQDAYNELIKTTYSIASSRGVDQNDLSIITGQTVETLASNLDDRTLGRMLTTEELARLIANVQVDSSDSLDMVHADALAKRIKEEIKPIKIEQLVKQAISKGYELGWDEQKFADAGLPHSSLIRMIKPEALHTLTTQDQLAQIVALVASDQEKITLADAVKLGRSTWIVEGKGRIKPDETKIVGYLDGMPNIIWQFFAYFVLTAAEILVSIVCLEFAYTQSPKKMKSFVMGVFFLGISLANIFVSGVNAGIGMYKDSTGSNPLEGANYYWFFGGLMFLVAVLYCFWAPFYKGKTFIQGDDDPFEAEAEAIGSDSR